MVQASPQKPAALATPTVATSVKDAAQKKATSFSNVDCDMTDVPEGEPHSQLARRCPVHVRPTGVTRALPPPSAAGLAQCTSLTSIDMSQNPMSQLTAELLPLSTKQLSLAGCSLTSLPPNLSRLTNLEKIALGANQ